MKAVKKKRAIHRVKILQGLFSKLSDVIEEDVYCIDVLKKSLAIQNALKSLDVLILESHLETCVSGKMKSAKEGKRIAEELLGLYKLSRKSQ